MRHRKCGRVARLDPGLDELLASGALVALPRVPGSKTIRYAVHADALRSSAQPSSPVQAPHAVHISAVRQRADTAPHQTCGAPAAEPTAPVSATATGKIIADTSAVPADLLALIHFVAAVHGSGELQVDDTTALAAQHPLKVRACLVGLAREALDRIVAASSAP
jgi:hypothetical protein